MDIRIIKPEEFDFTAFQRIRIQKRPRGNQGTRVRRRYKDVVSAFDIETTRLSEIEQGIMYVWQWAFGHTCVVGRTWEEFLWFATQLSEHMKPNEYLVVHVHNLSFEFSYLKGIYGFTPDDVFCMGPRKILTAVMMEHIELRCSYIHSNMSLKEYTEKMGAEHSKLSGEEFDYSKRRFPWTPLSDQELAYCVYDVIGLVEAVAIDMEQDHDTYYTFPLTSTGYCRRDAKKAMSQMWHEWSKRQAPSLHLYTMCKEAFRGGNTHGNRFLAGEIVESVSSCDRSSSYPDVLLNQEYPIDRFYECGAVPVKRLEELLRHNKAILMRVAFYDLKLKHYSWGCPYLSKDKCRNVVRGANDNGRIMYADYLETTITDVDYKIIAEEYEWDEMEVQDLAYTRYGKLPQCFLDVIIEYYRRKTALKGNPDKALDYLRSKQKLNSLYGMCAQDPAKPTILYIDDDFLEKEGETTEDLLRKDNQKRRLPPYQVGVWVTAWARYMLELGLREVFNTPGAAFVYTDTDSIKYTGTVDWSSYNNDRIRDSKASFAYADDAKGKRHYMGVLEVEDHCRRFITLGAKKYAYEDDDGKVHITVAGVIKHKGAEELARHGGLEAFKPSFIFSEAGGVEAVYNDDPAVKEYEVDGHVLRITSNVVLRESTYTLGVTTEYERLLEISGLTDELF